MSVTSPNAAGDRVGGETVAVVDFSASAPATFSRLLERTPLPVASASDGGYRYILEYLDDRLCLVDKCSPANRPFFVDLNRRRRSVSSRDPLRRAVGRSSRTVIDATAGFGTDTIHLARSGLRVVAVERCAVIAALLYDALDRLSDPVLRQRIELVYGDAGLVLDQRRADAVYLDPMFDAPERVKSLPRRAMMLARAIAGNDVDAADLLAKARTRYRRVIVKRPDKAPPLADGVHHHHAGTTVRYDVYMKASADAEIC